MEVAMGEAHPPDIVSTGAVVAAGVGRLPSRRLLGESACCANRSAAGRGARPGMPSGSRVTILPRDADRPGHAAAGVSPPDGRSPDRELARRGVAWWSGRWGPDDRQRGRLDEVRQAERVLGGQPDPIPPGDWWSGKGVATATSVVGNRSSKVYDSPTCRGVAAMKAENR